MEGLWLVSYLVLWVLFLLTVVFLFGVLQQIGSLHERLDKIAPRTSKFELGNIIPDFSLPAFNGKPRTLSSFQSFQGKNLFLVFVAPACSGCEALLSSIDDVFRGEEKSKWGTLIVALSNMMEAKDLVEKLQITIPIMIDEKGKVQELFGIWGTPLVMAIDEDRMLMAQELNPNLDWFRIVMGGVPQPSTNNQNIKVEDSESAPPVVVMRKVG